MSRARAPVVFLLDVDNTLLDNDRIIADLAAHLTEVLGEDSQKRYWKIFEQLRSELGYADYLGSLQRFRAENVTDPNYLHIALYLLDYPFSARLYPQALEVIKHLRSWGEAVILSDGDVVFQPRKVCRSGLMDAVSSQVLIYIHKEQDLADVQAKYPAEHYVLIDDKLRILTAVKAAWGDKVTTVFPRQGHYASDPKTLAELPAADVTVGAIGDLLNFDLVQLQAAAASSVRRAPL